MTILIHLMNKQYYYIIEYTEALLFIQSYLLPALTDSVLSLIPLLDKQY